jgi:hypothetical protein
MSTAPGVGPSGAPDGAFRRTDFGMDHVAPRKYDVIGTSYPEMRARLVSEERTKRAR